MPRRKFPLKTLIKQATWVTLPLVLAVLITWRVKTDEPVSLESIPPGQTKVLSRALHYIENNYVDPEGIDATKMLGLAAKQLEGSIAPLLVKEKGRSLEVSLGDKKVTIPVPEPLEVKDVLSPLSQLLGFLDLFYKGRLDEDERLSLVMNGVANELDPHSNYLPYKIYNEFKVGTKGKFGGLGIVIGIREGDLTVISPLEGTPAWEAGIRPKDKIIQIDDESTINMGLTAAVEKLRGIVGSKVSVVINRAGTPAPLKFFLTRALIQIQSVAGHLVDNKKIGLLKIKNFQEDTMEQFKKTLRGFHSEGRKLDGVILDLRNNPGGLLDQAIAMADFFLEKGTIVKTIGAHNETLENEEARPGQEGESLPVVVLINEGSASASEIVAGALQNNDRAVVIGTRSFGKGSVQTVYDLKDGSALKLTIAKYLTAKDQEVQSIGINPDVGLIPATVTSKTFDLYEDIKTRESDLLNKDRESEEEVKRAELPPPPVQMTYLASEKEGEEKDEDKKDENAGKIELQDDFPVHLATHVFGLPESGTLKREALLRAIPPLLENMKQEELGKISVALSKIGVDWTEPGEGPKGRPSGVATVEILKKDDTQADKEIVRKGLMAGETGFLRVTVENRGNVPFYRLAAVTKSDDPLFANLEFPFGRVNPQEKKSWKTSLKIPDFVHRRSIPVELEFHEAGNSSPKSSPFFMQVEEPPLPRFQYRYAVLDDGTKGSAGNGNGRMERGETISLTVEIKNIGEGKSESPVLSLKGGDDPGENENTPHQTIFIEKGREELKPMGPGEEASTTLRFRIPQTVAPVAPAEINLDLLVMDKHFGEDLNDRIVIPLAKTESVNTPPPGSVQSPPKMTLAPESTPLNTRSSSYKIKGEATDDQEVKHLFLFVGDEKVFYESPPTKSASLNFETSVRLKKGANLITLAAQDNRELTVQKHWIVWREK